MGKKRDRKGFRKKLRKKRMSENHNRRRNSIIMNWDFMKERMKPENIEKNFTRLKTHLDMVKEGKGVYSKFLKEVDMSKELIGFIERSLFPDEKKGIRNDGSSVLNINYYKGSDRPVWIVGNMGSIWFDCKTSDGNFWRVELDYESDEKGCFHVEEMEYIYNMRRFQVESQTDPNYEIPPRDYVYLSQRLGRSICESITKWGFVDNKVKVERTQKDLEELLNGLEKQTPSNIDFTDWKKNTLEKDVRSTITKVKDGYKYYDSNWEYESPQVFEDVDRLIWEFNFPKEMKKDLLQLNQS